MINEKFNLKKSIRLNIRFKGPKKYLLGLDLRNTFSVHNFFPVLYPIMLTFISNIETYLLKKL